MTQEEKENIQEAIDAIKAFGDYEDALEKQSPLKAFKDALKGEKQRESQALLDNFAKAAMQASMSNEDLRKALILDARQAELSVDEYIAKEAYNIATAMMQERERRMKG